MLEKVTGWYVFVCVRAFACVHVGFEKCVLVQELQCVGVRVCVCVCACVCVYMWDL